MKMAILGFRWSVASFAASGDPTQTCDLDWLQKYSRNLMTCPPYHFRVAVVGVFECDFGCAGSFPRQRLYYAIVVVKRLAGPEQH